MQNLVSPLNVNALKHQDRLRSIGPEIYLADDSRLMQFPDPRRLGLQVRFESTRSDSSILVFDGQDLHDSPHSTQSSDEFASMDS
jgi:hypothetical protein